MPYRVACSGFWSLNLARRSRLDARGFVEPALLACTRPPRPQLALARRGPKELWPGAVRGSSRPTAAQGASGRRRGSPPRGVAACPRGAAVRRPGALRPALTNAAACPPRVAARPLAGQGRPGTRCRAHRHRLARLRELLVPGWGAASGAEHHLARPRGTRPASRALEGCATFFEAPRPRVRRTADNLLALAGDDQARARPAGRRGAWRPGVTCLSDGVPARPALVGGRRGAGLRPASRRGGRRRARCACTSTRGRAR
jgi:hypothetical protein